MDLAKAELSKKGAARVLASPSFSPRRCSDSPDVKQPPFSALQETAQNSPSSV